MFKDILGDLLRRVDGSTAAFLAGLDGLIIDRCTREESSSLNLEQIAADCTMMIKNSRGLLDHLNEAFLCGTEQRLVLRLIPGSCFVVLLLSRKALTGRARYELQKLQSTLEAEIAR
jgi:predicted regulator of Ras-like GTPase activity (Roadblock/LC7/MglB family)